MSTYVLQIPQLFVESLLTVHTKYSSLIKDVFTGDQQFIGALDKVCNLFIFLNTNDYCIIAMYSIL